MQEITSNHYAGKPRTLFAKYAIPQMIGLLFNSIYLIVDGVFIGNRLGRDAMAAAAVSVPFIEILIALSMAAASGAGIIISNHLSMSRQDQARQTFGQSILITVCISAVIVLLGNLFLGRLATLLGATAQIQQQAESYLWYIVTFSPFLLLSFLMGALVRNDGKPKLAMFALAFGSISNIVLDYVFMYPLDMGISGAALATALGPIFSVLILLPHFICKKGALYFSRFAIRFAHIKQIFTLGFPSFIMEFTIGIITFIYNYAIIKCGYGELGLAAYLMIGYLMLIILTIFLGMAEGLQPVFSFFAGAHQQEKNHALLSFSIKVFFSIGILCYGLIALFSGQFFSIFAPGDAELIAFTQRISLIYFCAFFLAGQNILLISYWQSTQNTKSALLISLLRSIVMPPVLIFVLTLLFGSASIWLCHSLSEAFTYAAAFHILVSQKHPVRGHKKTANHFS
ncbi:MATE family efflux transporter [Eubacteriales bacterium OttesenSCG-928-N14]|nr:MATE family efflux transporter [Eubacteriales bacterium OttesenSCG-928-N14]